MKEPTCSLSTNSAQKELQPHGTSEFPCAAYASTLGNLPADAVPWHWHEEIEVIFLQTGTMKLQIPGKEYYFHAGSLVILNANLLHYIIGHPHCQIQSLVFSPFLITGNSSTIFYKKYLHPLLSCTQFTFLHDTKPEHCRAFQNAFSAFEQQAFAFEFTVREQLTALLLSCFQTLEPQLYAVQPSKSTDTLRIEKMLEFIQSHYQEPIHLNEISQAANLGERECLRCFHRTIQESPIQYLLKYRLMQSASMLLAEPAASIADIALACGFDHPSYYAKQFRRFYQCSPKDYRKREPIQP